MITRAFPGHLLQLKGAYILNDEQRQWLENHWFTTPSKTVARAMGMSHPTLYKIARKLGLERRPEDVAHIYKEASKQRCRTIRQEKLRRMSGLQPSCCPNIRLTAYSHRQANIRHIAVKQYGYIVYDHTTDDDPDRFLICYDADTDRHPQFEEGAMKQGFIIKDYEENEREREQQRQQQQQPAGTADDDTDAG